MKNLATAFLVLIFLSATAFTFSNIDEFDDIVFAIKLWVPRQTWHHRLI